MKAPVDPVTASVVTTGVCGWLSLPNVASHNPAAWLDGRSEWSKALPAVEQ